MTKPPARSETSRGRFRASRRPIAVLLALLLGAAGTLGGARGGEPPAGEPLRVAVYDVPPYGSIAQNGAITGVSVDLWRRVAEDQHWQYRLTPVSQMESILDGLEHNRFDAAIGAITITPERLARVDFSYPAHRSGVAVAFAKQTGPISAFLTYGAVVSELGSLIALIAALLVLMGVVMWFIERPRRIVSDSTDSSVANLRDGVYWAVVTMTTVGYGDKTPKTPVGRIVAVFWMLGSVALVSLLSTSLVSRMTAERVESGHVAELGDLSGKKLAAVAQSSGAEYLDEQHLPYAKYDDLAGALASLVDGRSDAVVNSVGALQYLIAARYARTIEAPRGLLAPAYMAVALTPNSPLKKAIDRALIKITASPDWRKVEESYFGP